MTTIVHQCEAKWGRPAYLKIVDDKVIFDCSDEEYGPIEFDIEVLTKALSKHYYAQPISYEEWHRRRDIMAAAQADKTNDICHTHDNTLLNNDGNCPKCLESNNR